jgi:hypothetical protein
MIYSVSYNYVDKIITVTLSDRTEKVYTEDMKSQYLSDFPNRQADIAAIGW